MSLIKTISVACLSVFLGYSNLASARYLSPDPVSVVDHTQMMVGKLRSSGMTRLQMDFALKGYIRASMGGGFSPSNYVQKGPYELNPYAYTANNPLRWTDPTGLSVAGSVCGALGIPPSACDGAASAAGRAATGVLGAGAGLMTFSPDAGCSDEEEEDCVEQWRRAYEICADQMKRGGGKGITGGHNDEFQCAKGLVSQKCGGNIVQ